MRAVDFVDRLEKVTGRGPWKARCPAHEDGKASLGVSEGDDSRVLVTCHAGCSTESILAAMGLTFQDLFDEPVRREPELEITYDYVDADGELVFQVVRKSGKRFMQRRPADPGDIDKWEYNLDGVERVLYRLPEVMAAVGQRKIFVVEGEKDANAIFKAGGVATCNAGGAGKWQDSYSEVLRGAHVVIVADKDGPGLNHAQQVAESLKGKAASIETVQASTGKDAYDHLQAGFGLADFVPLDTKTDGITLRRADRVTPEAVEWVPAFEQFVPFGTITVLCGEGGVNKSTLASTIAAQVTRETGRSAVFISTEDAAEVMGRPRLEAAGADLERCFFGAKMVAGQEGHMLLPDDVVELEAAVTSVNAGLLVIDPVTAHLSGNVDSNNDSSLRVALAPLARLAQRKRCAVLVIAHLNKDKSTDPKKRLGGSAGLYNISRSALLMAPHPDDVDGLRIVASFKNQYGQTPESQTYRLEQVVVGDELVPRTLHFGTDWRKANTLLRFEKKEEQ